MKVLIVFLFSWFLLFGSIHKSKVQSFEPETFRLKEDSVLYSAKGKIADIWYEGKIFSTCKKRGNFFKVCGVFLKSGNWVKIKRDLWIEKDKTESLLRPKFFYRPKGVKRFIIVDKSKFELKVIEKRHKLQKVIFKTKVATGIDKCLPKEEGGKCYFTQPGIYKVRWKVFDPEGIKWCIPKSMEKEKKYQQDLKSGKRCFRGSIGYYALNIGKTYAIHGTKNEASIGTKASHGCIRTKNKDMEKIFALMKEGDKVIIKD